MATVLIDAEGTLTHLRKPANAFRNSTIQFFSESSGRPVQTVEEDFSVTENDVLREPFAYGWIVNGYLAAYADEDPYVMITAVALELIRRIPEYSGVTEEKLRQVFRESTKPIPPDFKEGCLEVLQETNQNHELDIVTASAQEKVRGWFAGYNQEFNVIGDVKKTGINNGYRPEEIPEYVEIEGRRIYLRRPDYDRVLLEKKPDYVIGDVYSLDLALPQARDIRSILVKNDYTPPWVVTHMSKTGTVIEKLSELPSVIS